MRTFVLVVAIAMIVPFSLREPPVTSHSSEKALPSVPEWAAFFDPAEYDEFMCEIRAHFDASGEPVTFEDGFVRVEGSRGELQNLGLHNLAQQCRQASIDDWKRTIKTHFMGLRRIDLEANQLENSVGDFSRISGLLSMRLWPWSYLGEPPSDEIVFREDLPGVATVLVFELPSGATSVTASQVAPWGKTHDELFDAGMRGMLRDPIPNYVEVRRDNGLTFGLLTSDGSPAAPWVFQLERFPACIGEHGALVGLPHRRAIVCQPLDAAPRIESIAPLVRTIEELYREGPDSISTNLYWYHAGVFTRLYFD